VSLFIYFHIFSLSISCFFVFFLVLMKCWVHGDPASRPHHSCFIPINPPRYTPGPLGSLEYVSPWEIEVDTEEEVRKVDEGRRQQQAAQRAQRARASGRFAPDADEAGEEEAAARAAEAIRRAERAQALLIMAAGKPEDDEAIFNEEAYGMQAQQAHQTQLAQISATAMAALQRALSPQLAAMQAVMQAAAGAGPTPPGPSAAAAAGSAAGGTNFVPSSLTPGPLKPGQVVPEVRTNN
jgi:hypothetical protein